MRFKLNLEFQGKPPYIMPANYQYDLAESISKMIHFGDKKLISQLEKDGYLDEHKQFELFCFSNIGINDFEQNNDRLIVNNSDAETGLSVLANETVGKQIIEFFSGKELRFGDKKNKVSLKIQEVEKLPEPKFSDSMDFRLTSPLVITNENGRLKKKATYLSPEDDEYEMLFIKSIMTKYALLMKSVKSGFDSAINSNFSKLKFKCTSKPVSRIVKVKTENPKPLSVKGYMFDFNITAPEELIKLGYYSGFGEFCKLGFGYSIIR